MRTAGNVLRDKRTQLGLTVEQVERATKIRKNVLRNIEASNWEALPSPTHVKGFIKNYGTYLGLNAGELLALFRREVDEKKTTTPRHVFRTHLFRRFGLKPQLVVGTLVLLVIIRHRSDRNWV